MRNLLRNNRRGECGQAILESVITMLVVCIIFFGLLQAFHLGVAKLIADYSATVTARSSSVGFADYLVQRNGRCASIPASGRVVYPTSLHAVNPLAQYADERVLIPYYVRGESYLDYEYWHGDQENVYTNADCGDVVRTTFNAWHYRSGNGTVTGNAAYNNYPLAMPLRYLFSNSRSVDIYSDATNIDFSTDYLED